MVPGAAIKASRTFFPSSVLIGIFCRFGFCEENRPVVVPVCVKVACSLPSGPTSPGSGSIYVDKSFCISRCCKTRVTTGWLSRNFAYSLSRVDRLPPAVFFIFFPPSGINCISSNKTSPSCFGELILNECPTVVKIFSSSIRNWL